MTEAAKTPSGHDDVLASIRRLVAEESRRAPNGDDGASPAAADTPRAPSPLTGSDRPLRARPPERAGIADRHAINRAARAKLLLTDDFRVEDIARWSLPDADEEPETQAPQDDPADVVDFDDDFDADLDEAVADKDDSEASDEDEAEQPVLPRRAHARNPIARSQMAFQDEDQQDLARRIEGFLAQEAAPDADDTARAPGIAMPSADDTSAEARAARRRAAVEEAASLTASTAARRALRAAPLPEAKPAPQPASDDDWTAAPAAAPAAAPQAQTPPQTPPPAPAATISVDQIEAAVQASLRAYADTVAAPAQDLVLDEEALRDMVSEIVRRELQGSLGERITRNVRKLVRREIYRALETRDLG